MTFLAPGMLWFLLSVPVLAGAYVLLMRQRKTYVARFTNLELLASVAPRRPGWRRHVAPLMLLATLVTLIGGLARPIATVRVPREKSSIMLVVDVSRSMTAADLAPNRMTAAKQAAKAFLGSLPRELRVGVVAFSDTAALVSPLTRNRDQTGQAIDVLRPLAGTAVGDGLDVALQEIRRERSSGQEVPAAVLLLSDGASNRGRESSEVAQEARAMEVPVFTVGVGTEGAVLEVGARQVPVGLDEAELQGIAETTGATYFKTGDTAALRAVYRDLGSKLGFESVRREVTAAAAGIAAILLLGAAAASLLWFQRIP